MPVIPNGIRFRCLNATLPDGFNNGFFKFDFHELAKVNENRHPGNQIRPLCVLSIMARKREGICSSHEERSPVGGIRERVLDPANAMGCRLEAEPEPQVL